METPFSAQIRKFRSRGSRTGVLPAERGASQAARQTPPIADALLCRRPHGSSRALRPGAGRRCPRPPGRSRAVSTQSRQMQLPGWGRAGAHGAQRRRRDSAASPQAHAARTMLPHSVSDGHRMGQEAGGSSGTDPPRADERASVATWGGPSLTPIAWPLGLFELTLGTKVSCTLMYAFDLDLQPFGTGPDLQLSRRPQSHPCPPPLPTPRLGAPLTHGVPCEDGFRRGPRLSGARGPQGRDPELILTAVPQVHRRPLPLCGEASRVSPAPAGPGGGDPWPGGRECGADRASRPAGAARLCPGGGGTTQGVRARNPCLAQPATCWAAMAHASAPHLRTRR